MSYCYVAIKTDNENLGYNFYKINENKIIVSNHYNNNLVFLRLDVPIEEYVNNELLVGEYEDNDGKSYTFTEDCRAIFPDKEFYYDIGLDHIFVANDYLLCHWSNNNNLDFILCYEFTARELLIYTNVEDSVGIEKSGDPIYVLKKVSE